MNKVMDAGVCNWFGLLLAFFGAAKSSFHKFVHFYLGVGNTL